MFIGLILKKLRFALQAGRQQTGAGPAEEANDKKEEKASASLEKSLEELKAFLGDDADLKIHRLRFGCCGLFSGALLFFDGLASGSTLTEAILRPLTRWEAPPLSQLGRDDVLNTLRQQVLCSGEVDKMESIPELAAGCLAGDAVLLVDGCPGGLIINAKGWDKRGVAEPQAETVVRGPREGFTENLRTNTALIRRKIKNGKLRAEVLTIGRQTRTNVCLMYLEGIADPQLLKILKSRMEKLEIDSILDSGYIEQYIEDAPYSPFSTVGYTEKPDVAAAKLLEGRVAIVVDGTPFVLTAPMLFIESFQTAEDYYVRPFYASFMRTLRFLAYFIAVFGPAVYIALTTFHQELIPTTLLLTIARAREGTPFPVLLEAFIMVFAFEILREGGIRLPRPVGQAISIVGALIMGDAAVSAGLVGAPVVIAIAITAVAGFLVPGQSDSASLLRPLMMILASFVGIYGVVMGLLLLLIHLADLSSFGTPYFDGFAWNRNLQDTVIRAPLWAMVKRPRDLAKGNVTRRRFFIPPLRPHEQEENAEGGAEAQ